MNKQLVKKSKTLSKVLRHSGIHEGLNFDSSGFTPIKPLIKKFNLSRKELNIIVSNNNKQRFEFNPSENKIRACQGHNKSFDDIIDLNKLLNLISEPIYDKVYHGTNLKVLKEIKDKGLSRRERMTIHLSKSLDEEKGLRRNSNVILSINLKEAMKNGIIFYESSNGVILTQGNLKLYDSDGYNGLIPPELIKISIKKGSGYTEEINLIDFTDY